MDSTLQQTCFLSLEADYDSQPWPPAVPKAHAPTPQRLDLVRMLGLDALPRPQAVKELCDVDL